MSRFLPQQVFSLVGPSPDQGDRIPSEYMDLNFSLWAVGGKGHGSAFSVIIITRIRTMRSMLSTVAFETVSREANTKFNKLMNEEEMRDAAEHVLC